MKLLHTPHAGPGPAAILAAVILTACGADDRSGDQGYDLVFYSDRSGNGDLYLVDADGFDTGAFEPRRLLGTSASDFSPRWVPQGPGLVFVSEVEAPPALYALGPQAQGVAVRLGPNPAGGDVPAFTPDGSRMVYAAPSPDGTDLFVADLTGGEPVRITRDGRRKLQPAVSPDGRWVAYSVGPDGAQDLALVRIDGTEGLPLTDGPTNDGHPAWTPDGAGLVFDSNRAGVGTDIFHLPLEGLDPQAGPEGAPGEAGPRPREGAPGGGAAPAASGLRIGPPRNLTNDPELDLVATVSPDGRWVAFGSSRSGNWDIWAVPFQGGAPRQITASPSFEGDPRWVPAGVFDDALAAGAGSGG